MGAVAPSDHLYFGVLTHEAGMQHAEATNAESREADLLWMVAEREGPIDLTRQIFVLAPSKEAAEARVKEHFGYTTEMHLAPAGKAWVCDNGKIYSSTGTYGDIDWRELERCPECESADSLRHDASVGETECVACGWALDWRGTAQ